MILNAYLVYFLVIRSINVRCYLLKLIQLLGHSWLNCANCLTYRMCCRADDFLPNFTFLATFFDRTHDIPTLFKKLMQHYKSLLLLLHFDITILLFCFLRYDSFFF